MNGFKRAPFLNPARRGRFGGAVPDAASPGTNARGPHEGVMKEPELRRAYRGKPAKFRAIAHPGVNTGSRAGV